MSLKSDFHDAINVIFMPSQNVFSKNLALPAFAFKFEFISDVAYLIRSLHCVLEIFENVLEIHLNIRAHRILKIDLVILSKLSDFGQIFR